MIKKITTIILLSWLLISPSVALYAKQPKETPQKEDLQKTSKSKMINPDVIGMLATFAFLSTLGCGVLTISAAIVDTNDAPALAPCTCVFTILCSIATAGLIYGWNKMLKKHTQSNGKKSVFSFMLVNKISKNYRTSAIE